MTEETRGVPNSSARAPQTGLSEAKHKGIYYREDSGGCGRKSPGVAGFQHKTERMNKEKLNALLGEMLAESVKVQMKEAVHASSTDDSVIALASLRMVHDIVATGVEQGLNSVLPPYGLDSRAGGNFTVLLEGDRGGERRPPIHQVPICATGDSVEWIDGGVHPSGPDG